MTVKLDVTAALLFEAAALLLVLIGRASWTDSAVFWMSAASVLCWCVCGTRLTVRRLRRRARRLPGISENTR